MKQTVRSLLVKVSYTAGVLTGVLASCCSCVEPFPPPEEEARPSWASDSQRIVYECYLEGPVETSGIIDRMVEPGGRLSFYLPEAADLCISDTNTRSQRYLVDDPGGDWHPIWSPGGTWIAYLREDGIYLISPDGHGQQRLLPLETLCTQLGCSPIPKAVNMTWSPSGYSLLFSGCLDHADRDVYVVNTETGILKNLTSNSRTDDFLPMWTLNGTKIAFLSAESADSSSTYSCRWDLYEVPSKLRIMNADGSETAVVGEGFSYPFVEVSNDGLVRLLANHQWRVMDLSGNSDKLPFIPRDSRILTWSPGGEYLAYQLHFETRIVSVESEETFVLPAEDLIDSFVWSPDSQKIAVTTSTWENMTSASEEHIHIYDISTRTVRPLVDE